MKIRARSLLVGAVLAWALLGWSAPARAGAWVYPKGVTWFKLAFVYQSTGERYFLDGERIPYFFEGHNETAAAFLDFRHGLGAGFDVLLQLPIYSVRFDDLADERKSTGIADVRAGARWNFLADPVVATVGAVVKFPTGEFVNDAEVVPVGEGQYDFEVGIEVGRSLWPRPGYLSGELRYRFRTENKKNGIDPGDEIFWSFEGGYEVLPKLMVKGLIRGLYGFDATSFGLAIASLRREVIYLEPGVIYALSPTQTIEFSVPVTVRGRNWPAGPVLNVGFSQTF
jgi:hypothetical protein